MAVEYESAKESLERFVDRGMRISKIHLSSALKVADFSTATRARLRDFCDEVYLHQVVARSEAGTLERYEDLDIALEARESGADKAEEWRIHFHIPLHRSPGAPLASTSDHIQGVFDFLQTHKGVCRHFEMETYTWEVLPDDLGEGDVVNQLVREYEWTLEELKSRGLA